jgi:hypothetical protein
MNRLRKVVTGSLVSGLALLASAANAVNFPVFDQMDSYAQAEFIADMVDTTQQALREDGKPDLALKMEQLFSFGGPSDTMSVGLAELEKNVSRARIADLDRLGKDPKAQRLDVEDALFVTLKKNGIELSSNAMNRIIGTLAKFRQISHAEFRALPPSRQRHIVQLFAETAFPDYGLRDAVATKKSSFFGLGDAYIHQFAAIASTQFPHSGNQPGFVHVAMAAETDTAKAPDSPVFYTLVIYVLKELRKGTAADIKAAVGWSVRLPDGRHVYRDDDDPDVFWVVPDDNSKYTSYKLEANLKPLVQHLRQCMESSGIADGARAQAACLERVAH